MFIKNYVVGLHTSLCCLFDIDIEINVPSKETLEYENTIMEKIPHTDKYLLNGKNC